jgi:DNA-binding HxlR family transcriptional regulator
VRSVNRAPWTRRPRPGSPIPPLSWLPDGHPANVYSARCPSRELLDRIADRWTALICGALAEGPVRFGELRRRLEGISEKMLTQTLRSLERDGLVIRRDFGTVPPKVEYQLTSLGQSLEEPLAAVRDWAELHVNKMQAARQQYDSGRRPGDARASVQDANS